MWKFEMLRWFLCLGGECWDKDESGAQPDAGFLAAAGCASRIAEDAKMRSSRIRQSRSLSVRTCTGKTVILTLRQ